MEDGADLADSSDQNTDLEVSTQRAFDLLRPTLMLSLIT